MDKQLVSVAIVDDNALLATQLKENLQAAGTVEVLFTADNGESALECLKQCKQLPQVILMDIEMPVMDGIQATSIITSNTQIKVLVLTVFDTDEKVFDAIKAGASGYLLKDSKPHRILTAIEDVLLGGAPMTPHIAAKTLELLRSKTATPAQNKQPEDYKLSERETEVLRLLVNGKAYQQIANELFISHGTVRKHVENIYEKLHVNSKAQVVSLAYKQRWV